MRGIGSELEGWRVFVAIGFREREQVGAGWWEDEGLLISFP